MSELVEFLRKKQEMEAREPAAWAEEHQEWMAALHSLFSKLKEWVREAKEQGLLQVLERTVKLSEEGPGDYEAPALTLRTPTRTVEITPVGRLVIGAMGRVDVKSSKGRAKLLYIGGEGKEWAIDMGFELPSGPLLWGPNYPYLTPQSFTRLLEVMFL